MRFLGSLILAVSFASEAKVVEKTVEYKHGNKTYEGFMASPEKPGTYPGVLVIHDWMGISEGTKEKVRAIADLGYVAFAADIYGKGVRPKGGEEAAKLSSAFKADRKNWREVIKAAQKTLESQSNVQKNKIASMGYCFGGTAAIELARSGAPLKGAISVHGSLDSPTPADGKNIKTRILALHGADDPFVKAEDLAAFEKEMRDHKIDWQLVKYGNAVHSFTDKSAGTDNSKGAAYNEKADKRSWIEIKEFLAEVFK